MATSGITSNRSFWVGHPVFVPYTFQTNTLQQNHQFCIKHLKIKAFNQIAVATNFRQYSTSKIFWKVFINKNNLLSTLKFGFRKHLSTMSFMKSQGKLIQSLVKNSYSLEIRRIKNRTEISNCSKVTFKMKQQKKYLAIQT